MYILKLIVTEWMRLSFLLFYSFGMNLICVADINGCVIYMYYTQHHTSYLIDINSFSHSRLCLLFFIYIRKFAHKLRNKPVIDWNVYIIMNEWNFDVSAQHISDVGNRSFYSWCSWCSMNFVRKSCDYYYYYYQVYNDE